MNYYPSRIFTFVGLLIACGIVVVGVIWKMPLMESHRTFLFGRNNENFECMVDETKKANNVTSSIQLTDEDMEAFHRDGAILLRNVISKDWLQAYRQLLTHVFHNPNSWDILYSRLVANFYGAQKSIFLHQSSVCGRYLGSNSPATKIAADFFSYQQQELAESVRPVELRIIEPTEALINYGTGDGHTSWHRDDIYMHYKQNEMIIRENKKTALNEKQNNDHVVIRIWIPLMDMLPNQMNFMALNNSQSSQIDREKHDFVIMGTNFAQFDDLTSSHVIKEQVMGPGLEGYLAGDAFVFAGDTPHFAQGLNCSSVGCARLIFSYALDGKALYESRKLTSLLPLYTGQEDGEPLHGKQFPLVYPTTEVKDKDWDSPFDLTTYGDVMKSILHASIAGMVSFQNFEYKKAIPYFRRVLKAVEDNVWVKPIIDVNTGIRNK